MTKRLEPDCQPSHDPAADRVAQGMFLMFVVQGVKGRNGYFRFAQVPRRCFLLPELVATSKVKQVVAADPFVRRDHTKWGERKECLIDRISSATNIMVCDLTTNAILPLGTCSQIPLEPWSTPASSAGKRLAYFFVGEVRKAAEPTGGENIYSSFSAINVRLTWTVGIHLDIRRD